MTSIDWDPRARDFLRKLPLKTAKRIFYKVDNEISNNVDRFLEPLVNIDVQKIRIGTFRLFVDYNKQRDHLRIITIRHRRDAYKKQFN